MTSLRKRALDAARACCRAYLRGVNAAVGWLTQNAARPKGVTILHPQWLVNWTHRAALQRAAHIVEGTVLDVGCGVKPWKEVFTEAREYLGTDYLGPSAPLGTAQSADVCANATGLPFRDESVDSVVSTQCLEYIWDAAQAVAEMHRVLRPGGCVVLTTPFGYRVHDPIHDYVRYTSHGLDALFRCAGFSNVEVQPVGCLYTTLFTAVAVRAFYEAGGGVTSRNSLLWATLGRPLCLPVFALGNLLGVVLEKIGPRYAGVGNTFPPIYVVIAHKAGVASESSHGRGTISGRVGDIHSLPGDSLGLPQNHRPYPASRNRRSHAADPASSIRP